MKTDKKQNKVEDPREAVRREQMANWENAVAKENEQWIKTHDKKEFTFTASEARQLIKLYTIETLANQLLQDILNNNTLPRVGIAGGNENKLLYDLTVGRFTVWTPKKTP